MLTFALENSQMKKRYTEEQIIAVLREAERSGGEIRAVVRKHNISDQTFYR
jgi:putative transposase